MSAAPSRKQTYLLDTSALLALIEDEDGAERVEQILRRERALIPAIALVEVTYISLQEQGQTVADFRYAALTYMPATILWQMDEPVTRTAAALKATHHISLGDAIVAAYAICNKAVLVHKDHGFESLESTVMREALPFKSQ